jgi:putative tricarboxylic transport membrane protein
MAERTAQAGDRPGELDRHTALATALFGGAVGAVLLVDALRKLPRAGAATPWQPKAGLRVLGLVAALIGFALLLPLLGYVVTATALFVAAALLLGAPRDWRVIAWGWALAAVVFLVFDRLIGLTLPAGPWGF